MDTANKIPVVRAVKPVRPPSATPVALSTNVVVVETPNREPKIVARESANKVPLILGIFPSLSRKPALEETPIRVPNVLNISTNKKAKTQIRKFPEKT